MPAINSQSDATISEQAYLQDEQQADTRHEYVNGHVYAMAGASKRHNRIARNFITRMESPAAAQHCEVYFSDITVRTEKYKTYYYPDVVVGCAEDEKDDYYLEKPCLIIEVTSAATQRKDYLEKALSYQSIPSLQAYLIVAQDKPQIDMLIRTGSDWNLQQFDRMEDTLSLPCLLLTLNLSDIYAGINWDQRHE